MVSAKELHELKVQTLERTEVITKDILRLMQDILPQLDIVQRLDEIRTELIELVYHEE